jgi:hypothetical protein
MKKAIIIFLGVVMTLVLLTKFCNKNPENQTVRNGIRFKDSISCVSDSIRKMNYLMNKLPVNDSGDVVFILDKNELHFNRNLIGHFEGNLFIWKTNFSDKILIGLDSLEIERFFNLVLFLNENYLTSCNWHKKKKYGSYLYRELDSEYTGDYDMDFYRSIILENDGLIINDDFNKSLQILDRKQSLILVAPIDAKIY